MKREGERESRPTALRVHHEGGALRVHHEGGEGKLAEEHAGSMLRPCLGAWLTRVEKARADQLLSEYTMKEERESWLKNMLVACSYHAQKLHEGLA